MIIREVINILGQPIYRNHSDKGVYIRNKTTGLLYTAVNSSIDYEYEETDIEDEISDTEALNIILERNEQEQGI